MKMKVKQQKTEFGPQSKEKYLVQCHGRGLANEEDEKEHGWFRGFEGWLAYGFGLSLSLLLSLSSFPQIRRFHTHFFLKADVIFQGITKLIIQSSQTTFEPLVVGKLLLRRNCGNGFLFMETDSPPFVTLSYQAISVQNWKETPKGEWIMKLG